MEQTDCDPLPATQPAIQPWPTSGTWSWAKAMAISTSDTEEKRQWAEARERNRWKDWASVMFFPCSKRGLQETVEQSVLLNSLYLFLIFLSKKRNTNYVALVFTSAGPDIKIPSSFWWQCFTGYTCHNRKVPGVSAQWQDVKSAEKRTEMGSPEAHRQGERRK